MATAPSKRDVRLTVGIETAGEENIRRLADDVRRLAREGGEAAPEFAALAAQLDNLGNRAAATESLKSLAEQVERLTVEQQQAAIAADKVGVAYTEQRARAEALRAEQARLAEAVRTAQTDLVTARGAAQELAKGYTAAEKQTAAYTSRATEVQQAVTAANLSLVQHRQELERFTPAVREAEAVEKRLGAQFEALNTRTEAGAAAVRQRSQALQQAEAAALAAGVATGDLAASEQALLGQLQEVAAATNRLTQAQRESASTAAALADLDAQNIVAQERQQAALFRTIEAYEREEQAMREAAAAAAIKAQADFDAAESVDALAAAQARGRVAAESEQAAIRDSVLFLQQYEQGLREAAAADEALGASEGAVAIRKLEQAAKVAFDELRELTLSLRGAEKAAEDFAEASNRAASAGSADVSAMKARRAAAEELIDSERRLSVGQRELAQQRDANRAGLVADAQALLAAARAADESRAATARLVTEARQAGDAIENAFGKTGVRSLNAIEAEISDVNAALSLLERKFRAGALGADELERATASAAVRLRTLQTEIATSARLPSAFERMNAGINDLITRFGTLTAAIGTIGIAVRPVLDATIALDQMRRVLTTVSGSADVAEKQISFLRKTAQDSGQSFTDIGQSYAKFAASALQSGLDLRQTQDVFKAVSLAAGNLGLSTDQAKRALEALSQIASKGTVGMEELRQQLGDALPGVLPLLAKELGLTQRELQKVVESGNLLASEAIPAIGRSLAALQPQNGAAVSGLVAEWNRFKNVILEAGTAIVDGPFGQAAGVILQALAGVTRDVAVVLVSASEAAKLFGASVLLLGDTIAGNVKSVDEFKTRLGDFANDAATNIQKFKDTAYGTSEATDRLSIAAKSAGDSFAALALRQRESIDAAELRSRSSEASAQAAEKEAEAVQQLIGIITNEQEAADLTVAAAQRVLVAREQAAEAAVAEAAALRQARDAAIEKAGGDQKALEGLQPYLKALDEKIAKSDTDAAKQQALANKARVVADAFELAAQKIGDQSGQLDTLRAAVDGAQRAYEAMLRSQARGKATTEDVRQAATDLAKAKNLLRDALDDLSEAFERNLKLLRVDAELSRQQLQLELEKARNAEREALQRGNETQARQALLRIKELEVTISRVGIDLKRQEAEATLRELDALEQNLRVSGALTAEKQVEIEIRRKSAQASVFESLASNEANKAKVQEVQNIRTGSESLNQNSDALRGNTQSREANSSSTRSGSTSIEDDTRLRQENTNSILRQDAALERLRSGPRGAAGIGPSQDGENFGVRSAGGEANRVNGLTPIDSAGDLIRRTPDRGITRTGAAQFEPPDDSGDWVFDAEAYNRAVANPTSRLTMVDPRQFWRKSLTSGVSATPPNSQNGFPEGWGIPGNGFPAGWRTPAPAPSPNVVTTPAPAPARTPSTPTPVTINFVFGSRNVRVTADSQAQADVLIRELERLSLLSDG